MTEPVEPTYVRLTDQIVPWVQAAIEQHGQPDQVVWDAFPQMFPSPTNEGLITVVGVYAQMPGAVVGSTINASMAIPPSGATRESVNDAVQQLLESLRRGRSEQLNVMEQQQMAAARNGSPSPASGLIMPGK